MIRVELAAHDQCVFAAGGVVGGVVATTDADECKLGILVEVLRDGMASAHFQQYRLGSMLACCFQYLVE